MATKQNFLDYRALSEYTGIKEAVLRKYLSESRSRLAQGRERTKSDMPEPDITIGMSPAWDQDTIDKWLAGRPGKGVGGGRKHKEPAGH